MPRRPRIILPNTPLHIIQHGNNRQVCFFHEDDYLLRPLLPYPCDGQPNPRRQGKKGIPGTKKRKNMNKAALIKHEIYDKLSRLSGTDLSTIADFIDFMENKK